MMLLAKIGTRNFKVLSLGIIVSMHLAVETLQCTYSIRIYKPFE